jgi:transposase
MEAVYITVDLQTECEKNAEKVKHLNMAESKQSKRWTVVVKTREGKTQAAIRRETGYSKKFVSTWANRADEADSVGDRPRSGRPPKLTAPVKRKIKAYSRNKRHRSLRKCAKHLKRKHNISISYGSVRNAHKSSHLHYFRRKKQLKLTAQHKEDRLEWAQRNRRTNWRELIWTDEHTVFEEEKRNPQNDGVWAERAEDVPPYQKKKFPEKKNVWAGISYEGQTSVHWYTGKINSEKYQQILSQTLLPFIEEHYPAGGYNLEQDFDTSHFSVSTRNWLSNHNVSYIPKDRWTAKLADLVPLENLWSIIDEQVDEMGLTTLDARLEAWEEAWDNYPLDKIRKLIDSVPQRVRNIIAANGGQIDT